MNSTQEQIYNLQKVCEQIIEIVKDICDTVVPMLKNIWEKVREIFENDITIFKHKRKGKRYIYTYKKVKLWNLLMINRV